MFIIFGFYDMLHSIQLRLHYYLQKNQEIFIFPDFCENNTMLHGEAIIRADEIFFYLEFEIKNISD